MAAAVPVMAATVPAKPQLIIRCSHTCVFAAPTADPPCASLPPAPYCSMCGTNGHRLTCGGTGAAACIEVRPMLCSSPACFLLQLKVLLSSFLSQHPLTGRRQQGTPVLVVPPKPPNCHCGRVPGLR